MQTAGSHPESPVRVVMRDAATGCWFEFSHPRRLVLASAVADVAAAMKEVEAAVADGNVHAAGFVSYEAAPAFDAALSVHDGGEFPLLWFGLFEGVREIQLPTPPPAAVDETAWRPSVSRSDYFAALARIKALIRSGDTYQVNYTFRLLAGQGASAASGADSGARSEMPPPPATDPWAVFLRLAAGQDSAFSAFIDAGRWVICSASPELFFRLDGERIECRPMKGTAARGLTSAQDRAQAEALRTSQKERAENVMIVDMVRHDLGRVAQPGTVNVTSLFAVEKYPTLWQMTSTVEARTRASLGEIFGALFPPASVTGAPKVRTMQIISQLETAPRLIYTGAIGFVGPGRRAQFNVAIRTLLADRQTGRTEYGVGSGIVWDSEPEKEWRECGLKARVLGMPAPPFCLVEAMLWSPASGLERGHSCPQELSSGQRAWQDEVIVGQANSKFAADTNVRAPLEPGYWLLERHLQRLQASADYFSFQLHLDKVKLELERFASRLPPVPAKVRLLLSKDGGVKLEAQELAAPNGKPLRVALAAAPVDSSDPFLYHKTTNRAVYDAAIAAQPGYDAVLLFNERGEVTEFTRANVAAELDGRLVTPPASCGLLAGTFRAELLARGEVTERVITVKELLRSPRVLLANSVRGLYQVDVYAPGEKTPPRATTS